MCKHLKNLEAAWLTHLECLKFMREGQMKTILFSIVHLFNDRQNLSSLLLLKWILYDYTPCTYTIQYVHVQNYLFFK